MNEAVFGAAIAALSIGATYFFCIRPMRRNMHSMASGSQASCSHAGAPAELSEIDRLKSEIAALRQAETTPKTLQG